MTESEFQHLVEEYLAERLSPADEARLFDLLQQDLYRDQFQALLAEDWATGRYKEETPPAQISALIQQGVWEEIRRSAPLPVRRLPWYRTRWVAAAAVLLFFVAGGYWLSRSPADPDVLPNVTVRSDDVAAPTKSKARITLADGRTVALDSVAAGLLAEQGRVQVVKLDSGRIAYQTASGEAGTSLQYNTLTNPRGSNVIDMVLNDGSHVWLNAGSSVRYPVAFIGTERGVKITGEAYFEVAHDPAKPFYVEKGETEVKVLGTHFNVNAYDDEEAIKVTLLEGAVEVKNQQLRVKIAPGQQAISNGQLNIRKQVNVEEVMAWKNGKFDFGEKKELSAIMREIGRWYDVQVEIQGTMVKYFGGSISRSAKLAEVLKVLEVSSGARFKMEGRKIIVNP